MSSPAEPIISVRNLTAGYGDMTVLRDVSFDVRRGEVLFIAGSSGSGKSTLLKHMIGLHAPAAGDVLIDGDTITGAMGATRTRLLRKFGVTYQMGALFGSLNLLENVRLPLEEFTDLEPEAMDLIALMKLRLVGLAGSASRLPSELSGGMQKRAAIARAMALDPEILFLDEPSAGLDPVTSADVDQLILRLNRSLGITFVVVSHELRSIFAAADRVILLDPGVRGIIASGAPEELRVKSDIPEVRRFFAPELTAAGTGVESTRTHDFS
jgi:phospholipid/cholesterol/gamma-HCH transport system ATP-binding protein